MEDILFIAGTVGFFALGAAYIRFCDRIIGPDPTDAPVAASLTGRDELVEVGS